MYKNFEKYFENYNKLKKKEIKLQNFQNIQKLFLVSKK